MVEYFVFRSCRVSEQMDLHAVRFSQRDVDLSAFRGGSRVHAFLRTDRRVSPEVASDDGRDSVFSDFLRFRRVHEPFSADELRRRVFSVQDCDNADRRGSGSFPVSSKDYE